MGSENLGAPSANIIQEFLFGACRAAGEGAPDAAQGVGITAADHSDRPILGKSALVLVEELHDKQIVFARLRPVANLKNVKKVRHALHEFAHPRAIGEAVKEMVEGKKKTILPEVGDQLLPVGAQIMDFLMLGFIEPVNRHVNLIPEFGESHRNFLAHEKV